MITLTFIEYDGLVAKSPITLTFASFREAGVDGDAYRRMLEAQLAEYTASILAVSL